MDPLASDLPDATHYLRQVADLSERRPVVASEHIENSERMRLVRAGTRIDNTLYDKLVRHKLLKPLDSSLGVEDAVTVSQVLNDAKGLLSHEVCLANIVDASPHREPLRVLAAVALNEPLAFKMTVCREQAPEKYHHLLRVALAGVFLGDHLRLSDGELVELATAGLFHDLGELHLDPRLFAVAHKLNRDERRQIYVHPYVAYLILKTFPRYHPRISTAVLDHHERIDGSGYPRGLRGEAVSSLGLMLGVTELVVVMLERTQSRPDPQRMAAKLKLNLERFGTERVGPFIDLVLRAGCGVPGGDLADHAISADALEARLDALGNALKLPQEWPDTPTAQFIAAQIDMVRRMATRIGLSLETPAATVALLGDDREGLAEMEHLSRELSYQLGAMLNEVERRWHDAKHDTVLAEWLRNAEAVAND